MEKCPICSGELEETGHTDKGVSFKCKSCKADVGILEYEKCHKCGENVCLAIHTPNKLVMMCAKCGEIFVNEELNSERDNSEKTKNDNPDADELAVAFIIMLSILILYSVITFLLGWFNLIIFIILLIITIMLLCSASSAWDKEMKNFRKTLRGG